MKLEIFTLCDSAVDYGNRLCILGAFDGIKAKEVPYVHPHCAVTARLRFHRIEEGHHRLRVTFADEDGKAVIPSVETDITVRFVEGVQTMVVNLVLGINGLKLQNFGEYTVDMAVDNVHVGSLPLIVDQDRQGRSAGV
jgi:hypothetical protein